MNIDNLKKQIQGGDTTIKTGDKKIIYSTLNSNREQEDGELHSYELKDSDEKVKIEPYEDKEKDVDVDDGEVEIEQELGQEQEQETIGDE